MASATEVKPLNFFDFKPLDKRGEEYDLSQHKGKYVLAVNTASKCGMTPQFKGLEEMYKSFKTTYPNRFEIIGFPCNQFASQDPGSDDQIQEFCQLNYGVTFPMLKKTNVNGDNAEPVWEWMKKEQPGLLGMKRIKWNFEKFLIAPDGKVLKRWASPTKPEEIKPQILEYLEKDFGKGESAPTNETGAKEGEAKAEL